MALPAPSGLWPLIQFRNHFSQTIELLGRVISPSQGRYLNTGQHKHRINAYTHAHTYVHALSGIRTHDPSVRASEDSSCLRPRSYCDRLSRCATYMKLRCKSPSKYILLLFYVVYVLVEPRLLSVLRVLFLVKENFTNNIYKTVY
jgi:hypothetical protein